MNRLALPLALLVAFAPGAGGCDSLSPGDYEEQVVVSAVLVAGRPLPPIILTRTSPIDEVYEPDRLRIAGATITVSLLAADGAVEAAYAYVQNGDLLYLPVNAREAVVQGGRRYRFEAAVPGFPEPVRAETLVPTAFEVVEAPSDTLAYQDAAEPQGPGVRVTPSLFGDRPTAYLFSVRALAPDSFALDAEGNYTRTFQPGRFGLTPFADDLVADRDVDPGDFVTGSSPILNESDSQQNPDGTLTIRVPWLAVSYYGPQRFTATALDDALVDFLQSQAIQFIPTTTSPGEIPEVVTNVENGLGVFGAVAQVEAEAFIREP